jgi:integrase
MDADTYLRIKAVKNPRGASGNTLPKPYSKAEVAQLYEDLNERWPVPGEITVSRWHAGRAGYGKVYPLLMNAQMKAIVALALDCGMRANEIYRAEVQDIHPDNAYVVVRMGKSKISGEPKYREVPWTAYAHACVAQWLAVRRWLKPQHESPWLVLSPSASEMSTIPSRPDRQMAKARFGELLGKLGDGWSLHRLRHTCATMRWRAGMPIEALSKFLGHSTIQQTLCYTKVDPNDIQRLAERTEDRFNHLIGERA